MTSAVTDTTPAREPPGRTENERFAAWPAMWRFVVFVVMLGPAFLLDRAVYDLRRDKELRRTLESFLDTAKRIAEPFGIAYIVIAAWAIDPKRRRGLVLLVASVVVGGVTASMLKLLPGRERPKVSKGANVWNGPQWPGERSPDPSFPSAHTASAFAVAYTLGRLYPRGRGVFYCFALACALSRVSAAQHFLSDVIAGAWVGREVAGGVWSLAWLRRLIDRVPQIGWYPRFDWNTLN